MLYIDRELPVIYWIKSAVLKNTVNSNRASRNNTSESHMYSMDAQGEVVDSIAIILL